MPEYTSPSLPRRMAALTYDTCLVLPLIMLLVAVAMGLQLVAGGAADAEPIDPVIVQLLAVLGVMGFYVSFWRVKGQTLGMQAWRIQLRSFDGGDVSAQRCLLRLLGAVVSLAPLGLGFWWCLLDRRHRYWHDYLSGTELQLLPRADNQKQN